MIRRRLIASLPAVLLAGLLFGVLPACTPKKPVGAVQSSPKAAWNVFQSQYCVPGKEPAVKVKASLHYSRLKPIKRTNRTLVSMWGDFSGPMRLDVSASVGKLLAHIREDDGGLLVFYPTEKKAYAHMNPVLGATRLGMPFPFSLNELSSVIVGNFSGLVPEKYATGAKEKTLFVYELNGGLVSRVELDEIGRPIVLEGKTTSGYESARTWRLEINKYEEPTGKEAPLPGKLTLILDNGEKGVLYIKARELKPAVWPEASMRLELPETIETIRLDNGFRPTEDGEIPVIYEDQS